MQKETSTPEMAGEHRPCKSIYQHDETFAIEEKKARAIDSMAEEVIIGVGSISRRPSNAEQD